MLTRWRVLRSDKDRDLIQTSSTCIGFCDLIFARSTLAKFAYYNNTYVVIIVSA